MDTERVFTTEAKRNRMVTKTLVFPTEQEAQKYIDDSAGRPDITTSVKPRRENDGRWIVNITIWSLD